MGRGFLGALFLALPFLAFFASGACTKRSSNEVWVYTSIYKDTIAGLEPLLQSQLGDVKIQWYQAGTETVAERLSAEVQSGKPKADLVLISDPDWYEELKLAGHFLFYSSPAASQVPANLKDPEGYFSAVRLLPVVMIYRHGTSVAAPTSWQDLLKESWRDKVAMGSPLESGAAQALVTQWVRLKGWGYVEALHKNGLLSAGSSASVAFRVETGERNLGLLLLENALQSKKRGSPFDIVYPKDGEILMVSSMAILKKSKVPDLAKKVYDAFLSEPIQRKLIEAGMYSPVWRDLSPEGAPPVAQWLSVLPAKTLSQRDEIRKRFSQLQLRD